VTLSRREYILRTGAYALCVLSQAAPIIPSSVAAQEIDAKISVAKLSLGHFRSLSSWVTYQSDLDDDTVEKMFSVFQKEAWGSEHIIQIYNKLAPLKRENLQPLQLENLLNEDRFFNDGERWFVSHLLTTWFLGVYYHEDHSTQRITYEHALMYKIATPNIPIPFLGAVPFEEWSQPPTG